MIYWISSSYLNISKKEGIEQSNKVSEHCHNSAGVVSTSKVCIYTYLYITGAWKSCGRVVRRPAMLTEVFLCSSPGLQENDIIGTDIGNITDLGMYTGRSHLQSRLVYWPFWFRTVVAFHLKT
jgi:hypothetical protein